MENYIYYDQNQPTRFGPFMERWRDIFGHEGKYFVSDYGRVKSFASGVCKGNNDVTGYKSFTLTLTGKRKFIRMTIHRLVANAFISNPQNKPFVNHKTGDKHCNCVWELEWCTPKENVHHAIMFLPPKKQSQQDHRKIKITVQKDGNQWISLGLRKTARDLNIPYQGVQAVLKGYLNTYMGYYFIQEKPFINQDIITGKRICNKCHQEKDISKFHKMSKAVMHTCALCRCEALRNKSAVKRGNNFKEENL